MDESALKLMVTAGQVGALGLGIAAAAAGAISGFAGQELANRSDKQLASAQKSAATAQQTARSADREVAHANVRVAQLNTEAERLRASNLRLEEALEGERIGRLRLQERLRNRTLTPEQRTMFVDALKRHKKFRIRVVRVGDQEANIYASQIIEALQVAGEEVLVVGIGVMAPPRQGVSVSGPDAIAILDAFRVAHLQGALEAGTTTNVMVIGTKLPVDVPAT